ncbi:MAG: hypothetical protein HQM16_12590 [Deltaproteobacteria bacterium]|nr:hypothetical protein [Deltaproteobacteria bacterium]
MTDQEVFFDEIRRYKKSEQKKIIDQFEGDPLHNRREILARLSAVAEAIIIATYSFIKRDLEQQYGLATFLSSYKQVQPAHLAILGMGKFGDRTLNYCSDLDVVFVYSNRGETQGKKIIDNGEFFVKLAQRFISALSVLTVEGRCYEIDTELRPSGNQGPLVTSYDHFVDHQMNRALNWERQALVRARAIAENGEYKKLLDDQVSGLVYERPLPTGFATDMHGIRERVIREKTRETDHVIDIKLGPGSLMDIEFIVHHTQLKNAPVFPDLKSNSLFDCLAVLRHHDLFSMADLDILTQAHLYYRTIESLLHLIKKRAESIVDFRSETFNEVSIRLGHADPLKLKSDIIKMRVEVRRIFKRLYA